MTDRGDPYYHYFRSLEKVRIALERLLKERDELAKKNRDYYSELKSLKTHIQAQENVLRNMEKEKAPEGADS